MSQTRLGSFLEALANVAIGYVVAFTSQLVVFPLYGINVPLSTNLGLSIWLDCYLVCKGKRE